MPAVGPHSEGVVAKMIIQQTYHTYKDDFPLILTGGDKVKIPNGYDLDQIFRIQILDLSDLSTAARFTYIARHTNDKIPDDILDEFKVKFPGIASAVHDGWSLSIPTIWFTCYFCNEAEITPMIDRLTQKGIKHYQGDPNHYASLSSIPPDNCYTVSQDEGRAFPKFLHQVTQIGLDLLRNSDRGVFLRQYKPLEYRQSSKSVRLESMFNMLKSELRARSSYYREHIEAIASEFDEFCSNFERVNFRAYSWPHFLFNICGV
jgi:hypothetical protein